jgi:hypothetical protein
VLYGHDFVEEDGFSAVVVGCQPGAGSGSVCTEYLAKQLKWKSGACPDANESNNTCTSTWHKSAAILGSNHVCSHIIATRQAEHWPIYADTDTLPARCFECRHSTCEYAYS